MALLGHWATQTNTPFVFRPSACSLVSFWADKLGWCWFVRREKHCWNQQANRLPSSTWRVILSVHLLSFFLFAWRPQSSRGRDGEPPIHHDIVVASHQDGKTPTPYARAQTARRPDQALPFSFCLSIFTVQPFLVFLNSTCL